MRYYTTQTLGPTRELTPEGYLLCKDVPIARTGVMYYAEGEVPVTASRDGLIRVTRDDATVFSPVTMASFEGKPVTLDHPSEDVSPDNWNELAKGITQNVRRGEGMDSDLLMADLLITARDAIADVMANRVREVSLGYDADYEEIAPGQGRQANIFGNHTALVTNGRCGNRCAIGDKQPMKKVKLLDKLRAAFKNRDEAAFEQGLQESDVTNDSADETEEEKKKREAKESATTDALKTVLDKLTVFDTRLGALETRDRKVRDDEEEEKKKKAAEEKRKEDEGKTSDSASLAAEAQDVVARAEILCPGLHLPTLDAKAEPTKYRDALCGLRRKALAGAYEKFKDTIQPFGSPSEFQKMTCDAIASAFIGASEVVRRENNGAVRNSLTFDGGKSAATAANSIAAINKANAEFWKR